MQKHRIFISYSGKAAFETSLLQFAIEKILKGQGVIAWTFYRDQKHSENDIAKALLSSVKKSKVFVFLVTPNTLETGATQWMELGYANALKKPCYVLLHRLTFDDLKHSGVPPLLQSSQCTPAIEWKEVIKSIKNNEFKGAK